MQMTEEMGRSAPRVAQNDSAGLTAIYLLSFVIVLAIALVAQALALEWRSWFPGAESGRSMIDNVKSSVSSFMSYIA